MTRIRIIIPASTIERTKLYLTRGAVLLLCVFIFPLAAHASPFDTGISSIQTLFTGTIAKAASLRCWSSRSWTVVRMKTSCTWMHLHLAWLKSASNVNRMQEDLSRANALLARISDILVRL